MGKGTDAISEEYVVNVALTPARMSNANKVKFHCFNPHGIAAELNTAVDTLNQMRDNGKITNGYRFHSPKNVIANLLDNSGKRRVVNSIFKPMMDSAQKKLTHFNRMIDTAMISKHKVPNPPEKTIDKIITKVAKSSTQEKASNLLNQLLYNTAQITCALEMLSEDIKRIGNRALNGHSTMEDVVASGEFLVGLKEIRKKFLNNK